MVLNTTEKANKQVAQSLNTKDKVVIFEPAGNRSYLAARRFNVFTVERVTPDALILKRRRGGEAEEIKISLKTMKYYVKNTGYIGDFGLIPYEEKHDAMVVERQKRITTRNQIKKLTNEIACTSNRHISTVTSEENEALVCEMRDALTRVWEIREKLRQAKIL